MPADAAFADVAPGRLHGAKEHRAEVVRRALGAARPPTPRPPDPPGVLAAEGELEHAALAGLEWAGRPRERMPVVLDGVSTVAAALAALAFVPLLPTD